MFLDFVGMELRDLCMDVQVIASLIGVVSRDAYEFKCDQEIRARLLQRSLDIQI
jgi:hypothetical protein